jgi:hypothetical protein
MIEAEIKKARKAKAALGGEVAGEEGDWGSAELIGGGLLQAPFTSAAVKQLGDSVDRKRPDDLSNLMEPSDETLR